MAMSNFQAFFVVFLLILVSSNPTVEAGKRKHRKPPATPPPPPPPPEHHILAVQWGFTVCGGKPKCPSFNIQKEFTIHGLWSPINLTVEIGAPYVEAGLQRILPRLKVEWLDAEWGDDSLWRHEYKEHGIFMFRYNRQYLEMGLKAYDLVKTFDLGKKMYNEFGKGAIPSVSETVLNSKIRAAIRNHNFGMVCDFSAAIPKLRELWIYLKLEKNRYVVEDLPAGNMPKRIVQCPAGAQISLPLS